MPVLVFDFREMQTLYALTGNFFFPVLAGALLVFNGRATWLGRSSRNGVFANLGLVAVLLLFAWVGWSEWRG